MIRDADDLSAIVRDTMAPLLADVRDRCRTLEAALAESGVVGAQPVSTGPAAKLATLAASVMRDGATLARIADRMATGEAVALGMLRRYSQEHMQSRADEAADILVDAEAGRDGDPRKRSSEAQRELRTRRAAERAAEDEFCRALGMRLAAELAGEAGVSRAAWLRARLAGAADPFMAAQGVPLSLRPAPPSAARGGMEAEGGNVVRLFSRRRTRTAGDPPDVSA